MWSAKKQNPSHEPPERRPLNRTHNVCGMIPVDVKNTTEGDLQRLIAVPVMESDSIEYKAELSLDDNQPRRRFLAGVAAFANGSGGHVIYGVQAEDGQPTQLRSLANFDPDQTLLRIRDLVRTGIAPPILSYEMQPVKLTNDGYALVLRIRKTWAGAHMVTYNGDNRFYIRHGGGRRLMDVPEIRSAFVFPETIRDKVEQFRLERLERILAGQGPCDLRQRPALVVHLIPLRAFDPTFQPNLEAIRRMVTELPPIGARAWGIYYDLEGLFISDGYVPSNRNGYIYAFRNGTLEVLDMSILARAGDDIIPSQLFEEEILENFPKWLAAAVSMAVEPPVVLLISLLNVRGYRMALPPGFRATGERPINREHVHLPGTILETLTVNTESRETPHNVFDLLRPHFDVLWNACGFPRSIYFDDEGNPQY